MQVVRRLYVYLMSGIGLALAVAGIGMLLSVLFAQLGLASGEVLFDPDRATRERLTLATALTATALPLWLVHWYLAERSMRAGGPQGEGERTSAVRALYLALVLGALAIRGLDAGMALLQAAVVAMAGRPLEYRDPAGDLALLIVVLVAWGYHARVALRDRSAGPMQGAPAWLLRAYLYLAALAGLLLALFGLAGLLDAVRRVAFEQAMTPDPGWWAVPLGDAASRTIVGAVTWLVHWRHANGLLARTDWRGESERRARLRLAYYVAVTVVAASATIGFLVDGTAKVIEAALGVERADDGVQLLAAVLVSVASAAIFAAAGWLHVRWMRAESGGHDSHPRVTVRRMETYPPAVVGLAAGSAGIGWLMGLAIDVALGGDRTVLIGSTWQSELARYVGYALFGMALWLWQWSRVQSAHAADPTGESASTTRRAAVLLVLAGSIVASVSSVALILYRVFGTLFGASLSGNTVSALSTPIGILVVALAVAAYHVLVLRGDQARAAAVVGPSVAGPPLTSRAVHLRLSLPVDGDPAAVLARLRQELPPGHSLEELSGPPR